MDNTPCPQCGGGPVHVRRGDDGSPGYVCERCGAHATLASLMAENRRMTALLLDLWGQAHEDDGICNDGFFEAFDKYLPDYYEAWALGSRPIPPEWQMSDNPQNGES
jgi:hypothetical protein